MSARRYPTAELYEERQRYGNGGRSVASYDDIDIDVQRGNPRRSAPDFLREDYGRTSAGPLVVRDRHTEEVRGPPRRREVEEDTLVIRGGRGPPSREIERDDVTIRREERERPRPREVEETDITIKHRDSSRPRPREVREVEREDITFRRGGRPPPEREIEREDITISRNQRERPPPPRDFERDEISFRREESRGGRDREVERDSLVIRNRERSLPPPRERGELVAREREEFVVRRREPPPPPRDEVKEEIIIRRMEQRSPTPPPPPPPPPEPEPIIRPPIIQEVITHHRHIDHGIERARSPTPPPPPSPPRDESLEISIRRRDGGEGRKEILYERETIERKEDDWEIDRTSRRRSYSAPRRRFTTQNDDLEEEADFYNRKMAERAYIGEAYNGATKDWAIVDVPPGTNRVRMEGQGGGAQEVTWQAYNGVRRSKFIAQDEEISSGFGVPEKSKPKTKDMWTEITKDLVIKEAIESMGFDYEETEFFFYVMEYLRYEDVLQLVELSDDIRRKRQSRFRAIDFEREEIRDRRPPKYDERFYEREVTYDSSRRRY
ncbi:uncharacterized protein BDZ99DRAFT_171099 [Mytilinidion resinicola]|uniref:DUF8035 domain-containing protein n=1 Tax=Mytilinidion resinicola TaxID=574789 RepID=A0A6A6Y494_9PEZI|nr:uncharacterized protein BDZ99DRAFT_171099 [Mytilinidion resinicola]KAF2803343.1 hypothetical protein BDZ99DRAFT_171099 [Mytilinidion resinicola]